jgi:hypothetical protein
MKLETTYFEEMGIINTEETLQIAKERALKIGIKNIIIASTYGHTIQKALETFQGTDTEFTIVGGKRKEFPDQLQTKLTQQGHKTIFNNDHNLTYPTMAWEILRRFSEGMKVCVQMTLIATDLGILPTGIEAIAIAGTGRVDYSQGGGADTAIIIETVKSKDFLHLDLPISQSKEQGRKIKEILCKPR